MSMDYDPRFGDLTFVRVADPAACPFCRAERLGARCALHKWGGRARDVYACSDCQQARRRAAERPCCHGRRLVPLTALPRPLPGDGTHVIAQWPEETPAPRAQAHERHLCSDDPMTKQLGITHFETLRPLPPRYQAAWVFQAPSTARFIL